MKGATVLSELLLNSCSYGTVDDTVDNKKRKNLGEKVGQQDYYKGKRYLLNHTRFTRVGLTGVSVPTVH